MTRETPETRPPARPVGRLRKFTVFAALITVLGIGAPATPAQDMSADRLTFRGFGTLGLTTHDADGIEYRRNSGQARGAESGDLDLGTDSIAGMQLDVSLNSRFDIMVQGVSRLSADGDWDMRLSQGFLRYSPDDSLVLRAGRIGFDIYLLAESRQVGYSYLAVRPSPEFYGQITNDDIDGFDVAYTLRAGSGLVRARLFGGAGTGELAFADGSQRDSDGDIYGATFDYLYRGWTARLALVEFNYAAADTIPLLVDALRMTGFPDAAAVADDLDDDVYQSHGVQIGVARDDGPLLLQLMYGYVESDSIAGPDFDKIYTLFGYRLQKWTPYLSYASSRDRKPVQDAGLPPIPQLAPLNDAVVTIQNASRSTQHTATLGVRYDLNSNVAFKLQLDRTHVHDSALMFDYRSQPGTTSGGPYDMNVFTATLDFVF